MRVRGFWPYLPDYADRPISLPIKWQEWIVDAPGDGGDVGDGGDTIEDGHEEEREDDERGNIPSLTTVFKAGQPGYDSNSDILCQQQHCPSSSLLHEFHTQHLTSNVVPKNEKCSTITFKDPIANPSELEAVIHSSRQQPNWKAAQIEGQSWEGSAEVNILKFQRIMHPPGD